jgi:putative nucleotidyltransferase with HDIG domain
MDEFLAKLSNPILDRIISLIPGDEPVYLVGGAIRNALLNRPGYDLDLVIPGNAIKLARQIANALGAAYFPLDTQRNMARLVLRSDKALDVPGSSLRQIDFSTFQGSDLISDLQGRDFTMNAMAVEVHALQTLIDPLGGAVDLASKRLRACSQQSIFDDPIRILRAVRFSVEFDLSIQPETLQFIRQAAEFLPEESAERLRDELFRILLQSHPSSSIRILDYLGALEYVLPEISILKNIKQSPPHIMDVWDHTLDILVRLENLLEVLAPEYNHDKAGDLTMGLIALRLGRYRQQLVEHLSNALNPDRPHRGLLFLASLYHDVGKLKTQAVDEKGKIRFIEHESIGSKLTEKRGKALKLSNQEIERLVTIVNHHMRPSLLSHTQELPSRKAVYRFFRDTGAAGVDICLLSMADMLATYGPTLPQERWVRHLEVVQTLLEAWWEDKEERIFPAAMIDGNELMDTLEISPGPLVGYLLESIREAQINNEIHDQDEAIRMARKLIQENLNKKNGLI